MFCLLEGVVGGLRKDVGVGVDVDVDVDAEEGLNNRDWIVGYVDGGIVGTAADRVEVAVEIALKGETGLSSTIGSSSDMSLIWSRLADDDEDSSPGLEL